MKTSEQFVNVVMFLMLIEGALLIHFLLIQFVHYPEATIKSKGIATAWLSKVHIN